MDGSAPIKGVTFTLNGQTVEARPGETIWQVAQRLGTEIPHLCWLPEPGYRADGNCRACMVEIEGERVLAASCIRKPTRGHEGEHRLASAPRRARKMVFELLVADQPPRAAGARRRLRSSGAGPTSVGVAASRFPARRTARARPSHPAMAVNLDACIQCNLCVRACREVQVNDVIGMAYRGAATKIVFDFDDPMGAVHLRRLRRMRAGLPDRRADAGDRVRRGRRRAEVADKTVDSVCPYCGVGCQITYPRQGRHSFSTSTGATGRPTTTGSASRAASASTTCAIRTG